jgi:hypothetical protein
MGNDWRICIKQHGAPETALECPTFLIFHGSLIVPRERS